MGMELQKQMADKEQKRSYGDLFIAWKRLGIVYVLVVVSVVVVIVLEVLWRILVN